MKGNTGELLTPQAELQAVLDFGDSTFACHPDEVPQRDLKEGLIFAEQDIHHELALLNPSKAVPKHTAPNAPWVICSGSISGPLSHVLNRHFQAGSREVLQGDMRDTHVAWLPKPSKPPTEIGALRPVGLMPPYPKIIAGLLARQIQAHIQPYLAHLPQYAYSAGRGCADAIHKVHAHFDEVAQLLKDNLDNRFKKRPGAKILRCAGGACLSLDLSRALIASAEASSHNPWMTLTFRTTSLLRCSNLFTMTSSPYKEAPLQRTASNKGAELPQFFGSAIALL